MKRLVTVTAATLVLALGAAYGVRRLAPTTEAAGTAEAAAGLAAADEKMMGAMNGNSIVYSDNPDGDFVTLMIPHHQGAVDMAEVELQYGRDPDMRTLAKSIALSQQPQIAEMSAWRQAHTVAATPDGPAARQGLSDANVKMMQGMMSSGYGHSGNPDVGFVRMMIPHHQGAVDMGQVELKFGKDPQLRALAQAIITAQQREIAQMTRWLRDNDR